MGSLFKGKPETPPQAVYLGPTLASGVYSEPVRIESALAMPQWVVTQSHGSGVGLTSSSPINRECRQALRRCTLGVMGERPRGPEMNLIPAESQCHNHPNNQSGQEHGRCGFYSGLLQWSKRTSFSTELSCTQRGHVGIYSQGARACACVHVRVSVCVHG